MERAERCAHAALFPRIAPRAEPPSRGSPQTTSHPPVQGPRESLEDAHKRQSTHGVGLARTRASGATAGAGTELRASSEEWSSTAFRRLGKALNFFRTYSFGYMHHHSAIFYLWAAWFAFSFVPFVSLARSLSFLSFFLSSSLWRASALWRARLPARAWRSSISPSLPPLSTPVPPRDTPICC